MKFFYNFCSISLWMTTCLNFIKRFSLVSLCKTIRNKLTLFLMITKYYFLQSRRGQRQSSDDVDAVGRLPLLNDTYYQEILCEMGGMFAIANRVDNIHRRPWIGFQSWRAAGRKVFLLFAIIYSFEVY